MSFRSYNTNAQQLAKAAEDWMKTRKQANRIRDLVSANVALLRGCEMALARMNLAMANDHASGFSCGIKAEHIRQLEDAIKLAEGSAAQLVGVVPALAARDGASHS